MSDNKVRILNRSYNLSVKVSIINQSAYTGQLNRINIASGAIRV